MTDRPGRGSPLAGVVIAALTLLLGTAAAVPLTISIRAVGAEHSLESRELYVNPRSAAAVAVASGGGEFAELALTPTAIWLTPESYPLATVRAQVSEITDDAAIQQQLPVFAVYGIPDRDCGQMSRGGLDERGYQLWVAEIAAALGGPHLSIVIIEPDSLALADECGHLQERLRQIRGAVSLLQRSSTFVYLDGGHSNWLPAERMAELLRDAGVQRVRGFATNVANFNTTPEELDYAESVSALLGGSHFVIDTSRNGNGAIGEWCNPPGRAIGDAPHLRRASEVWDAALWIKVPGESDGSCNGGPPAGQWWPDSARELLVASNP